MITRCLTCRIKRCFRTQLLFISSGYKRTVLRNDLQSPGRPITTSPRRNLDQTYFLTTPIFYVNAVPHIGHLHTVVLADAVARWHRICGKSVVFSTGTDEHGLKVQQSAQRKGQSPGVHCDEVSKEFRRLFDMSGIKYTDYIRTTEDRHKEVVHHFWRTLEERGHIYKGKYEGWYSTSDEAFLTEDEVTDIEDDKGNKLKVSLDSGQPVEWMKEDNYMFQLSAFTEQLSRWLDTGAVQPVIFEPMVRGWLRDGLSDLSVSRQSDRIKWGIPVPGDSSQTIYVWLDALVNYLTVAGYPSPGFKWPANSHVIGKDILRFHAVYWPAFLMAAGLSPPERILCHSHWTVDGHKMSKSRGNVVDPYRGIEQYTVDGMRYFLLREGVPHSDGRIIITTNHNRATSKCREGISRKFMCCHLAVDAHAAMGRNTCNHSDFTHRRVVECLNSELVNTLANLLSRSTSPSVNQLQMVPPIDMDIFKDRASAEELDMLTKLRELPDLVDQHYCQYNIYRGLERIIGQLHETNAFFQHQKPWQLAKDNDQSTWLNTVLGVTMESLRVTGILLQPVIPEISDRILNVLSVGDGNRSLCDLHNAPLQRTGIHLNKVDGPLIQRIKL